MNSLLSMLGNSQSAAGTSILLQAIGAAMRGEDPHAFMKRLANQHPQLKKMNLNDLQAAANQLAQQNGVNVDDVAKQLDSVIDPMLPNK